MYPHHRQALNTIRQRFEADKDVLGMLLVGSIAHDFARPDSDVDILVVVPDALHAERMRDGMLTFIDTECCSWESGYVDGKYISPGLMERIRIDGSEPARFAYDGASVVFSRDERIEALLPEIARYPVERKNDNLKRFYAQFQAWNWYCSEAAKHDNAYLLTYAVSNLVLFGGRLLLAHNEVLYPYHKWFPRVLGGVREKPDGLMAMIDDLLATRKMTDVARFFEAIAGFRKWPDASWSHQFMIDSELSWMTGYTPVADV